MKIRPAGRAMAMAFGMISGACSGGSDTPSGTGGTGGGAAVGTGGGSSGSGGAGGSCPGGTPCGGNVFGTWSVSSSCLKLSGNVDVSLAGLDPRSCVNLTISGSLSVSGTWTANANGTYTDDTTTTGNAQLVLPAGCLAISGTTTTCERISAPLAALGLSLNCQNAAGGGCTCAGTVEQRGGIGWLTADPQTSGNYTTSGNTITVDGVPNYSYCVAGSTMTWTPATTSWTTSGTIVFQSAGTTGTGGTTGAGGRSGAGGASGSGGRGGQEGSGGAGGGAGRGGSGGSAGTGGTGNTGGRGSGGRAGSGGTTGSGGATGTGGSSGPPSQGPCDIYNAASVPCVAAYSPVRRLLSSYSGPLYQVRRSGTMVTDGTGSNMKTGVRSGGTTQDIGHVDGFGDGAAQDTFCGSDPCTISILYDQSGIGNHLRVAPAGCYDDGSANLPDFESNAKGRSLMVGGHKVYALYTNTREGYRNNAPTAMPMETSPQGIYMVADGRRYGTACCWDFGNASKDNCYGTTGMMDALFLGTGFWGRGAGNGPWFMADFEGGVWATGSGASSAMNANLPSSNMDYALGILKTTSTNYVIRVGNALSGSLTTATDSASPKGTLRLNGAIILGIGGDNSNHSYGTFYEGVITAGRPSDATDASVVQNVQAAGYGN
jgi:hypothetical protein